MRIEQVDAAVTAPLRLAVLRPGRRADATGPGHAPGAVHLAAIDGDQVVGSAVLLNATYEPCPDDAAMQLRGMAVSPARQGSGIGALVVEAAVDIAARSDARVVWCNARSTARGFYERHGFLAVGAEFITPDIGLAHFLMWRNLRETPPRPTE